MATVLLACVCAAEERFVGEWPGYVRGAAMAVAVEKNRAYVATDAGGLMILDISEPARPVRVGGALGPSASDVTARDNLAFVTSRGSLEIYNANNPTNLVLLGASSTSQGPLSVELSGDLALVGGTGGLELINVRVPSNPVTVGFYAMPSAVFGVAAGGNLAFAASFDGALDVIDISDPSRPAQVGHYQGTGNAWDVAVAGDYAFLVASTLDVIDISDPSKPVRVSSYLPSIGNGALHRVTLRGNLAFVAYAGGGLEIVDISNPLAPIERSNYDTSGVAWGVAVNGDNALVADWEGGVKIFDVRNPDEPQLISEFATDGIAIDVVVTNKLAVVADGEGGLNILDATNPSTLKRLGSYAPSGGVGALAVRDNLLYAYTRAGLEVLDIRNPILPIPIGSSPWGTGGIGRRVRLVNDLAFVADSYGELSIFDVHDPKAPKQISRSRTTGAYDVTVLGNVAYVADGRGGLLAFDVSDPVQPQQAANYSEGGFAYRLEVADGMLFLANGLDGLLIFNITDGLRPKLIGKYPTGAMAVKVAGNYAFLSTGAGTLECVDVSNPSKPLFAGRHGLDWGEAFGITLTDNLAFIANGRMGIKVIDLSEVVAPVLEMLTEGGSVSLRARGIGGTRYAVEHKASLSLGQWTQVSEVLLLADSQALPPLPSAQQGFYRLRIISSQNLK